MNTRESSCNSPRSLIAKLVSADANPKPFAPTVSRGCSFSLASVSSFASSDLRSRTRIFCSNSCRVGSSAFPTTGGETRPVCCEPTLDSSSTIRESSLLINSVCARNWLVIAENCASSTPLTGFVALAAAPASAGSSAFPSQLANNKPAVMAPVRSGENQKREKREVR
jgi:hypothetical protein